MCFSHFSTMNMIRYILMVCSLITMIRGFPPRSQPSSPYLEEEIILCSPDLSTIAKNLCKDQFLNKYQS